MKRSEMHEILREQITDKWDLPFGEYDRSYVEAQEEFFNDILNIIEKAGMFPPFNTNGGPDCNMEYKREWEPEESFEGEIYSNGHYVLNDEDFDRLLKDLGIDEEVK